MTFAVEEAGEILSQDARGRVLVSRERRESLLEQYGRSGMSGVKFAQYVDLEQPKHCKRRNSNLRPLQFLPVNRLLQGTWRDAYGKDARFGILSATVRG